MYGPEEIRKVQKRLLEMAVTISGILEKNGIPYFITFGSLLGAVRHGGFIPWDDDFDFYLFDDSYQEAMEVLKENMPSDMFLENEDSEQLYFHGWAHVKDLNSECACDLFPQDNLYSHHGISIDLYRLSKMDDEERWLHRLDEHCSYIGRKYSKGLISHSDYTDKISELRKEIVLERSRIESVGLSSRTVYASVFKSWFYEEEVFPLRRFKFEDTEFYGPAGAESFLARCYGDYMSLPSEENRRPHYSDVVFLDKGDL